jgi:hypothetical protein
MTLNEVLELGKMGFTKDDILRMNQQSGTKPQPQEQTEPQPQEQTVDFLDEIKKLRQEIALNFATVQTEKEESVDDILANILNPKEIK